MVFYTFKYTNSPGMAQYLTLLYSSWMFMAMLDLESLPLVESPTLSEIRSCCGLDNPGSINMVANLVTSRSSWYSRISLGSLDPKSFRRISCWISGLQFFFGHQSSMRPCPFQWRRGMQWGRYNLQWIQMTPGLPSGKRLQFAMERSSIINIY